MAGEDECYEHPSYDEILERYIRLYTEEYQQFLIDGTKIVEIQLLLNNTSDEKLRRKLERLKVRCKKRQLAS